ncbi:hypothetical protein NMG60_11003446 [Bertholletia excelsa]
MEAFDSLSEVSCGANALACLAEESSKLGIDVPFVQRKRLSQVKRKIGRVPLLFRNSQSNNKDYNPRMVSIGPYHHGKDELQAAEKLKPVIAELFVSNSCKTINEFYEMVLPMVNDLKSYYVEGSLNEYSNEEFATMMLLDGCLVLAFIEIVALPFDNLSEMYVDEIKCLGMHARTCFSYDILYLMENQLPFRVLQLLISLKYEGDDGMNIMNAFLDLSIYWNPKPGRKIKVNACSILAEQQPLHLLELRLITFNRHGYQVKKQSSKSREKFRFYHVLHYFRSVRELKAKGIYVRRNGSTLATSVKFKSYFFFGVLDLPIFYISPNRRIRFSNLIACEFTLRDENMLCQTSFINFLKSLINQPEDVKELRSKRILISELYSSDEEVVNLVNSITTYPVENYDLYDKVKESIQKHYDSKAKTWIAELIHTYFSSPWTFIAFLAAIFVVALSCTQTYYAIFPRS